MQARGEWDLRERTGNLPGDPLWAPRRGLPAHCESHLSRVNQATQECLHPFEGSTTDEQMLGRLNLLKVLPPSKTTPLVLDFQHVGDRSRPDQRRHCH